MGKMLREIQIDCLVKPLNNRLVQTLSGQFITALRKLELNKNKQQPPSFAGARRMGKVGVLVERMINNRGKIQKGLYKSEELPPETKAKCIKLNKKSNNCGDFLAVRL